MAHPQVADGRTASNMEGRIAVNVLNKQSRTADKGWAPAWGLGEVLTTPHRKNVSCCETVEEKVSDMD